MAVRAATARTPVAARARSRVTARRTAPPLEHRILITATLCLLAFGAVMVYSASSPLGVLNGQSGTGAGEFLRYVIFGALGLLAMHVLARRGLGRGVEQHRAELDRCEPVDHAVVGLADHRQALVARVLAYPHLPQRTVAAQWRGHHFVDQAREGAGGAVEVPVDREPLVIDPLRGGEPERHRRELLTVARGARDAPADVLAQLLEARQPTAGWRREQ